MKATGIIRRIDDLGRIVIPKEIRRTLNFKEGDPIELFVDDNHLVLQKYTRTNEELKSACARYVDTMKGYVSTIFFYDGQITVTFQNRESVQVMLNPNDEFDMNVALCHAFQKVGYTTDNPACK